MSRMTSELQLNMLTNLFIFPSRRKCVILCPTRNMYIGLFSQSTEIDVRGEWPLRLVYRVAASLNLRRQFD